MSEIDFYTKQALDRASFTRSSFEPSENVIRPEKSTKIKEKHTSLPVEIPEGKFYPDFKTVFKEESEKSNQNKEPLPQNKLQSLMSDPESALLGGLIMLLKSEGADEALLTALGYILL